MNTLEFSLHPGNKGNVFETEFITSQNNFLNYNINIWDFGDGTTLYNSPTSSHIYQFPGVYRVSLSAWSEQGYFLMAEDYINVDYIFRDGITFTNIPEENSIVGIPTSESFVVSVTSCRINEPISITLHALNTNSLPEHKIKEKWQHLAPKWKFVDALTNKSIDSNITLNTSPIYRNSKIVAVSGSYSFYYVDDTPTQFDKDEGGCPVILLATLSSQNFSYPPESLHYPYYSYSNNETVQAAVPRYIMNVIPTELKITENFLSNIFPIKWTGVPIPVMTTCVFNPKSLNSFSASSYLSSSDILTYPKTNYLGKLNTLDLKLSGVDPKHFIVNNTPLYFQAQTDTDEYSKGYVFTTITPLCSISTTCVLASTVAVNQTDNEENSFPFPVGYIIPTEVYISHPNESNINKIIITPYSSHCTTVNHFKQKQILNDGLLRTISMPSLTSSTVENFQLSGASGIYGLSYNPYNQTLYAADSDKDVVYKIDNTGKIVQTAYLSGATQRLYNTPTCISIDKDNNVWIALYDNYQLLKYNSNLTNVLASAVPLFFTQEQLSGVGKFGSPLVAPPMIETTKNNEVWACYAGELSSSLIKYSSSGIQLTSCDEFDLNSEPACLALDKQDNIWVACKRTNAVQQFNSNGKLLQTIDCLSPSFISIDNDNEVWILHGYNLLSHYNPFLKEMSTWRVFTNRGPKAIEFAFADILPIESYTKSDLQAKSYNDEIWGGLTVDVFNRVWFIDSETNKVVVIDKKDPLKPRIVSAFPTITKNFIIKPNENYVSVIQAKHARSLQAAGDWSGNRWFQKYSNLYNTTQIFGNSTPFEVHPLLYNNESKRMDLYVNGVKRSDVLFTGDRIGTQFGYQFFGETVGDYEAEGVFKEGRVDLALKSYTKEINNYEFSLTQTLSSNPEQAIFFNAFSRDRLRFNKRRNIQYRVTKINQTFDFAQYLKDLALPKPLLQSKELFETFLSSMVGNGQVQREDLGKTCYEKIANFNQNHCDPDTAEIEKLHSFAKQFSLNLKTFGSDFPVEVKDYLNLFSVPLHFLRGTPIYETDINENIGAYLTLQTKVSSGSIILAKDKVYDTYSIINLTRLEDGSLVYPLSSLQATSLRQPLSSNYHFFEYNISNIKGQQSNLIDWDSRVTSISYNLSSENEWIKDNGLIDLYFNNLITRNLFN